MSEWAAARGAKWRAQSAGMEAMLAPFDEPLIRKLQLDEPYRIADVGCGAGGATFDVLRCAPPGSVVHGYDISPDSIDLAREREASGAIAFELADMSTADPPDELYDRLVSRFGIMFFEDPPAAFANLRYWLEPGGRFAFGAWGEAAENPWQSTVREVVSRIVDLPPVDPDAPGPFRYGDPAKLVTLLDRAGFAEIQVHDWRGIVSVGGGLPAAEAANFALASFSSYAELLTEAGTSAMQAAREALTARYAPHEAHGAVRMDARVHIVSGRVIS